jgi:Holliday junction resolvase RusA-like endonuclease
LINAQSLDLSNVEKLIVDALFIDKHENNLQIDDRNITRMVSEKCFGEDYRIEITIHIKALPKRQRI